MDPLIARLGHGLYSFCIPHELGGPAPLRVLVMRCNEVELASVAAGLRDPEHACVEGVRRVLHELILAAALHAKIAQRPAGVTIDDVAGFVASMVMWAH